MDIIELEARSYPNAESVNYETIFRINNGFAVEDFVSLWKDLDIRSADDLGIWYVYQSITGYPLHEDQRSEQGQAAELQFKTELLNACTQLNIKLKHPIYVKGVIFPVQLLPTSSLKQGGLNAVKRIALPSKEDPSSPLAGVLVEDGKLIGCNRHALVVVDKEQSDDELKELLIKNLTNSLAKVFTQQEAKVAANKYFEKIPSLEGKVLWVDTGEVGDGEKYPKYKNVIPENDKKTLPLPIDHLINIFGAAALLNKNIATQKNTKYSREPTTFVFRFIDKQSPEEKETLIGVKVALMLETLQVLRAGGVRKVSLEVSTPSRGILIATDTDDIGLVMPEMIAGPEKYTAANFEHPLIGFLKIPVHTRQHISIDRITVWLEELEMAQIVSRKKFSHGGDVEMEHTQTFRRIAGGKFSERQMAEMIAADHRAESPNYYRGLHQMELKLEKREA